MTVPEYPNEPQDWPEWVSPTLDLMNVPKAAHTATWRKHDRSWGYTDNLLKYVGGLDNHLKSGLGIYIHGPYGSGKSTIASMILREAMFRRKFGYFLRASEWAGICINSPFHADTNILLEDRIRDCPALVIDDLKIRAETKFIESNLEDLIRYRTDKRLLTIVTSNISPYDLASMMPSMAAVLPERYKYLSVDAFNFRTGKKNIGV